MRVSDLTRTIPRPVILVVEDEPLIRWVAIAAFENAGFEVLEAEHGDAALLHLRRTADRVVAIFTDIQMPGKTDGVALAQEAQRSWPWIHLMITSGQVRPAVEDLPARCRFLPKPYECAAAVYHVQEMIAEPRQTL